MAQRNGVESQASRQVGRPMKTINTQTKHKYQTLQARWLKIKEDEEEKKYKYSAKIQLAKRTKKRASKQGSKPVSSKLQLAKVVTSLLKFIMILLYNDD